MYRLVAADDVCLTPAAAVTVNWAVFCLVVAAWIACGMLLLGLGWWLGRCDGTCGRHRPGE